jgi:hypothetical protein
VSLKNNALMNLERLDCDRSSLHRPKTNMSNPKRVSQSNARNRRYIIPPYYLEKQRIQALIQVTLIETQDGTPLTNLSTKTSMTHPTLLKEPVSTKAVSPPIKYFHT